MPYTYEYPRPALTVDNIIFTKNESGEWMILLIQRKHQPYKEKWAFPGGFVDMDETTEQAALRELEEETQLKDVTVEQFYTFSEVNRDPRGRTVSVVYYGFVDYKKSTVHASDDAAAVNWFSLKNLPALAFDHDLIIGKLLEKIQLS